jgi:hypothetical protein
VSSGLKALALIAILSLTLGLSTATRAQQPQQQPQVPDAPSPQAPTPLTGTGGPITPGIGAGTTPFGSSTSSDQQPPPSTQAPATQAKDQVQTKPPDSGTAEDIGALIRTYSTYVEVPVTVKDTKGKGSPSPA